VQLRPRPAGRRTPPGRCPRTVRGIRGIGAFAQLSPGVLGRLGGGYPTGPTGAVAGHGHQRRGRL